jgi:hypothetical protein
MSGVNDDRCIDKMSLIASAAYCKMLSAEVPKGVWHAQMSGDMTTTRAVFEQPTPCRCQGAAAMYLAKNPDSPEKVPKKTSSPCSFLQRSISECHRFADIA